MEETRSEKARGGELDLIERARAGDREAFEALMNRYRKDIYHLAYRIAGNHHDADDIAQDTFVKAYLSLKKFRGFSSFRTWIYSIALNTARTVAGREGKSRKVMVPLTKETIMMAPERKNAEPETEVKERLAELMRLLPARQREVLLLKIFHGMKHREIARALGITAGAAKANLFHAIKFLRSRLEEK
ncbi:MAG: RNA polymerase sigma factor [Acidobacteriota bacterium]